MWRDTGRFPQFFAMDARVLAPIAIWALHWSWPTFYVAVVGAICFAITERMGVNPTVAFRAVRTALIGRIRPVQDRTVWRRRTRW